MHHHVLAALAAFALSFSASAQLTPWEDYTVSEQVMVVNTIKVEPNMMDYYLEGIRQTWVASNEVSKKLGHIVDYGVYMSDLPNGSDFNLVLFTIYENTAAAAPSEQRYKEFMEAWGEANEKRVEKISRDYPAMREIIGQLPLRQVQFSMDDAGEDEAESDEGQDD